MKSYENSIKNEKVKLKEIEKVYCCYLCGKKDTNILEKSHFSVDKKEKRIICDECADSNKIMTIALGW